MMADQHTAAAAQRALYRETKALLDALNAATDNATDPLEMAGVYCAIIAARIMPLREALADVEFYEQAERIVDELFKDRAGTLTEVEADDASKFGFGSN